MFRANKGATVEFNAVFVVIPYYPAAFVGFRRFAVMQYRPDIFFVLRFQRLAATPAYRISCRPRGIIRLAFRRPRAGQRVMAPAMQGRMSSLPHTGGEIVITTIERFATAAGA